MLRKNLREDQDYHGWLTAFCARKVNSDFALEIRRSVAMYLRSFSE